MLPLYILTKSIAVITVNITTYQNFVIKKKWTSRRKVLKHTRMSIKQPTDRQLQRNKLWFAFSKDLLKAFFSKFFTWEQSQSCKKHLLSSGEHLHCSQHPKFSWCFWHCQAWHSVKLLQFSPSVLTMLSSNHTSCHQHVITCFSIISSALPRAK